MDKKRIADSFSQASEHYDSMAYFQRNVGDDLLALVPSYQQGSILDLGSGTGHFSAKLLSRYPRHSLVSMDLAHGMNCYAKRSVSDNRDQVWVTADAEEMPFQANSFDLVYSNLALQWCQQIDVLANQVRHVLVPDGMLWYSTLLPGTLSELRTCWKAIDHYQHVNRFIAKEDILGAWEAADLSVVDIVEREYQLYFEHPMQLMRELKGIGAHFVDSGSNLGLTGPGRIKKLISEYQQFRDDKGRYLATYHVMMLGVKK